MSWSTARACRLCSSRSTPLGRDRRGPTSPPAAGSAAAHAAASSTATSADNCLVGSDGRIRVTDFGSRRRARPRAAARAHRAHDLGLGARHAGVHGAQSSSPAATSIPNRSVQLLRRALRGAVRQRPFVGKTFDESAATVRGPRAAGAGWLAGVGRCARSCCAGSRPRPGDRFPTMDHLLAELGRDRHGRGGGPRSPPPRSPRRSAWAWSPTWWCAIASPRRSRVVLLTGRRPTRVDGLTGRFDSSANQVYSLSVMREVSSARESVRLRVRRRADRRRQPTSASTTRSRRRTGRWVQDFAGHAVPDEDRGRRLQGRMM